MLIVISIIVFCCRQDRDACINNLKLSINFDALKEKSYYAKSRLVDNQTYTKRVKEKYIRGSLDNVSSNPFGEYHKGFETSSLRRYVNSYGEPWTNIIDNLTKFVCTCFWNQIHMKINRKLFLLLVHHIPFASANKSKLKFDTQIEITYWQIHQSFVKWIICTQKLPYHSEIWINTAYIRNSIFFL